ncbi:uncharacterized protein LOC131681077 [Topomyia yanbarensis]|uniref:uncharacterized protein LOC131681077 n=1 Tax=Topomyia yanbarensis TaxID=2498891 RepID=UPI00273CC56E|nr:uncharacterized protein LOC131681077 [Topomyia yanbarensis]
MHMALNLQKEGKECLKKNYVSFPNVLRIVQDANHTEQENALPGVYRSGYGPIGKPLPLRVVVALQLRRCQRQYRRARPSLYISQLSTAIIDDTSGKAQEWYKFQNKWNEKQLKAEKEMREKELANEREMHEQKLKQEQELLERQLATEQEFLEKQERIRRQVNDSKMRMLVDNRSEVLSAKDQMMQDWLCEQKSASNPISGDIRGAYGKGKNPRTSAMLGTQVGLDQIKIPLTRPKSIPNVSEEDPDTDESNNSDHEERGSRISAVPFGGNSLAGQSRDGSGHPFRVTKDQLAVRQAMSKHLPIFKGEPEVWPLFISSFEYTTAACGFTNLHNLKRWQDCLKGDALVAVRSRLVLPDSVPDVLKDLRNLFGKPEKLLRTLLHKVRSAQAPRADRLDTFIHFGITVKQLCDHLEAAGMNDHMNNPMLVQELVEKLPPNCKLDWVRFKRGKVETPLRMFTDFVTDIVSDVSEVAEFSTLSLREPVRQTIGRAKKNEFVHLHESSAKYGGSGGKGSSACWVCKQTDHLIRNCDEFRRMRVPERLEAVDRLKLCTLCLNNHGNNRCNSKMRCSMGNCQGGHHPLLHRMEGSMRMQRADCNTHKNDNRAVIFRMVPITLYVGRKAFNTIAFLDEGSSSTLIEEAVANKLGAKGESEPLIVSWTGDIKRYENGSHRVSLMLSAQGSKEKFRLENVHTVSNLVLPKQDVQFSEVARRYSHLAGVSVTDYGEEQPTIMIGLDNIHLFAPLESRIGGQGEPIAVRSRLGWTVYGPEKQKAAAETFLNVHIVKPATNEELHDMMREQYALDEAGITSYEVPEPVEEQRAREILRTTTKRVGKRFQTGLLWREDERNFPDSYPMSMRRLLALERKLNRDPALDRIVREQISDYQIKGYAHKATAEELEQTPRSAVWYLPLNVVLNPRKPGKVRLVWDAAATVNGVSLNSELLKRPDMLVPLPRVICHFREKPVAFGADIQEMYHQVRIREEDKQAQRFLFREALTDAPQVYVMDVATFGSTCSPSSAQFVKNMNAEQFAERYPEVADAIIRRHYVDDYYDSVDTVDEAIKRANEVNFIHSQGGFNIRNWVSNSTEFLEALGERTVETAVHFNRDKCTDYERVLGIVWEPVEDVFCFAVASKEEFCEVLQGKKRSTKRSAIIQVAT